MFRILRYWIVLVQALFVLALAANSAEPVRFELSRPITAALMIWSVGCIVLLGRTMAATLRTHAPPAAFVAHVRAELSTLSNAFTYALLLGFAMALHGWAKTMIPHVSSYWADPMLADWDHALFGQDPWPLFRNDALSPLFAKIYICWFPVTFGTAGVLAFSKRDHSILLTAFLAILLIVGTIGQYVLPSVGPIFYERMGLGTRFAGLATGNDPTVTFLADYLWSNYESGGANLGTGISAMPSMHVTLAVWTMLAARALWRPLVIPAALYALIIYVTSIATGWHYATDGIVGAILVVTIYAGLNWYAKRSTSAADGRVNPGPDPVGVLA